MKVQFKYAFLNGVYIRGPVFAVIFVINTVFIVLSSAGLLPFAAHVTAVSLAGIAVAVMLAANIIGDVAIARRLFGSPDAYLQALTPAPRWKSFFASIITMTLMDFITMVLVIGSVTWLSINFANSLVHADIWSLAMRASEEYSSYLKAGIRGLSLIVPGYFLVLSIILLSVTAKRSIFYKMPAPGLLAFFLACLCFYAVTLSQLLLIPFGSVVRYGIFIIISLGSNMIFPAYFLLLLLEAAALFVITSKLIEKRMNI